MRRRCNFVLCETGLMEVVADMPGAVVELPGAIVDLSGVAAHVTRVVANLLLVMFCITG